MSDIFLKELIKKYPNSMELGQAIQYWVHFREKEINLGITNITESESNFLKKDFQFKV